MKLRTRIFVIVAVIFGLIGVGAIAEQHVTALTGDPVVTVTAPSSVVAGSTITFDVTINQPGYAPTNGSQKITLRTLGGGTNNFANYTVIPMQTLAGPVYRFTWQTPALNYVGRLFTFSVPVCVSSARICRTVTGAAGFTLDPVPAPTTTTEAPTTTVIDTP